MSSDKPSRRGSSEMQSRARNLRRNLTVPERALWNILRGRQLSGFKFRRQQVIGPYIADFYCSETNLVIEVDGESHVGRADQDAARDAYLKSHGMGVLRVTNDDALRDPEAVALAILQAAGREE